MGLSILHLSSLGWGWRALRCGGASARALPLRQGSTCAPAAIEAPQAPEAPTDGGAGGEDSAHPLDHGTALGVFENEKGVEMTNATKEVDGKCGGKISKYLNTISQKLKLGKAVVMTDAGPDFPLVALASVGPRDACYNELEGLEEARENVRWGMAAACRALHREGGRLRVLDACHAPDAAVEAATLTDWSFKVDACADEPRALAAAAGEAGDAAARAQLLAPGELAGAADLFREGHVRGRAQNWARYLSDMPANLMTPVDVAQAALDTLCPLGVQVLAHDRDWIVAQRMQAFLAVARGSCEAPVFLECVYRGAGDKQPPVLLSAKGITFDSGGLCLKKPASMVENRGSMAGAAVVLAAIKALAELKVPLNVAAVIPLCENMISGQCMKVGDVVCALNGMSIQIENTDMEGRLLLADALVYGQARHRPALLVNVATLTHGVELATGGGAFGCFSNNEAAWSCLHRAGALSGDRPWRLPLWRYYQRQITNDAAVDLRNQGSGHASPCLGAAFLQKFICCDFVHMDITGVGKLAHAPAPPYLDPRRMTGRPTRTLIHFLQDVAKNCLQNPKQRDVTADRASECPR